MTTRTRTVDLLVLGATVAGLTTALAAAGAGASVLVVDPNQVSRFGLGLLTVGMGDTLREVEVHRGIPAGQTLIAEAGRAIDWLTETLPSHGVTPTARTTYSLAVDGHLAFHLRQEARLLRHGGAEVDFTDGEPLPGLVTRPALVLRDQAQVDPNQHRQALTAAALAAGVEVVTGVGLGRFIPGQPWTVTYDLAGYPVTVTTPSVVDTIGVSPWGRRTGGSLRVCPVLLTEATGLSYDLHVLVDTPAALVFTLRGHGVVVAQPTLPRGEHAATVDLVAFASRLGLTVTSVRSRHIEVTGDRLPYVGRVPLLDGAWLARGFGLWETTLGTAAGLQLGAAVTGGAAGLPWPPLRTPAPLALYRRWNGEHSDPMVGVPQVLRRRGLTR